MGGDALPGLAAAAGLCAGAAVTWIVAHRKSSGRIRTSEAETLWAASESIRHDLTAALAANAAEITRLKADMLSLTVEFGALQAENKRLSLVLEVFRKRMEGD